MVTPADGTRVLDPDGPERRLRAEIERLRERRRTRRDWPTAGPSSGPRPTSSWASRQPSSPVPPEPPARHGGRPHPRRTSRPRSAGFGGRGGLPPQRDVRCRANKRLARVGGPGRPRHGETGRERLSAEDLAELLDHRQAALSAYDAEDPSRVVAALPGRQPHAARARPARSSDSRGRRTRPRNGRTEALRQQERPRNVDRPGRAAVAFIAHTDNTHWPDRDPMYATRRRTGTLAAPAVLVTRLLDAFRLRGGGVHPDHRPPSRGLLQVGTLAWKASRPRQRRSTRRPRTPGGKGRGEGVHHGSRRPPELPQPGRDDRPPGRGHRR